MDRVIRWYDFITINIYWFALTTRAQVLTPLIVPLLVQDFVGETAKGRYVGVMRLWALMAAVLLQALMGMFSDRSTLRWGRRRPFIVAGTIGEWVVFVLIGFTAGLGGMSGYWVLFGLYLLSMVSSNTAHAATQGLIPDLVPLEQHGRFSGVKVLFELPLPLIFVSFVVGRLVTAGSVWGALFSVMVIMLVCMLVTLLVREKPLAEPPFDLDWGPFLRLVLMTAVFTLIILGAGAAVTAVTACGIWLFKRSLPCRCRSLRCPWNERCHRGRRMGEYPHWYRVRYPPSSILHVVGDQPAGVFGSGDQLGRIPALFLSGKVRWFVRGKGGWSGSYRHHVRRGFRPVDCSAQRLAG